MSGGWYRHPIVAHISNFGCLYCACHGTDKLGMLGTRSSRNIQETVEPVRDGYKGEACDWPGCTSTIPHVDSKDYEYVNPSLHENL